MFELWSFQFPLRLSVYKLKFSVTRVSCFDFVLLLMSRQLPGATRLDNGYWGQVLLDNGAGVDE